MDVTAKALVACQLYDAISEHGDITSGVFGSICSDNNTYATGYEYLRAMKDIHICSGSERCYVRRIRTPRTNEPAMLCHNSLTADHIIIHNNNIVAIVGWSRCTFGFMHMQAAGYAYRLDLCGNDDEWLTALIHMIINTYAVKHDRVLNFCIRMYLCRLPQSRSTSWLEHFKATLR